MVACNETGSSTYVLVCEHASNYIPREYGGLGLPPQDLERHIAWDIGAAALAQQLSSLLDAPLFVSGYSRLLIDCNRPPLAPTSIPVRSEATEIPGNRDLDEAERERRAAAYFWPFQTRIARALDERAAAGRPTALLGIHSFTPIFLGVQRPWHVGVLWNDDARLPVPLLEELRADAALVVGDNEPYSARASYEYTLRAHAGARHLPHCSLEVRQDLMDTPDKARQWGRRLAGPIGAAVARALA